MKIVGAEVFVTCPGRNFVTLKITTDEGIVGWVMPRLTDVNFPLPLT